MRAGSRTLTLLGASRTILILRSLSEGKKGRLELRRDAGLPAQSTLRSQLDGLEAAGVVVKSRPEAFPGALEYTLGDPGRELLAAAAVLERWLAEAPQGPLELGSDGAKVAIKGLVESWRTTVLTALAEGPRSLTELDRRIPSASYPAIDRCLETMRLAGQLEVGVRGKGGTPYALTEWLRRGVAPLTLAARWEHRNQAQAAVGVTGSDIAGTTRLVAPLLPLAPAPSALCQLAVKKPGGKRSNRALASLVVDGGQIAFAPGRPDRKPDAWASATASTWFDVLVDAEVRGLRLNGDRELPLSVFAALRETLFGDEGATGSGAGEKQLAQG